VGDLIAAPDGAKQLSEGLVVEASVVARLLRIRLLAIDARLIVAPAAVEGRTRAAARGADAMLAPVTPPTRTRATGAGLTRAARLLSEAAASLAASRAAAPVATARGARERASGEGGIRTLGRG
jgi:hypothetical protein